MSAPSRGSPWPEPLPCTWGPFLLRTEVGRGHGGRVYRAEYGRRVVALKVFAPGTGSDGEPPRIDHPAIVPVEARGIHAGRCWQVSELIPDGSLDAHLRTDGPLPPHRAAPLLRDLARIVQAAHEQGRMHGGLKPANVFPSDTGMARVTDFGLPARPMDDLDDAPYRPPEGDPSIAGDVYRLGGVLYAALTARPPFAGVDPIAVAQRARKARPISVRRLTPGVATDLIDVCMRCLSKQPSERYPSAAALANDLDRLLTGQRLEGRSGDGTEAMARFLARNPAGSAALAGLAGLLLPLLFVVMRPGDSRSDAASHLAREAVAGAVAFLPSAAGLTAFAIGLQLPAATWWTGLLGAAAIGAMVGAPFGLAPVAAVGGALAALGWQATAAGDAQDRTWLRWAFAALLFLAAAFAAATHWPEGGALLGLPRNGPPYGLRCTLAAALGLPVGVLTGRVARRLTAGRMPPEVAPLAATLGALLGVLIWAAMVLPAPLGDWLHPVRQPLAGILAGAERLPPLALLAPAGALLLAGGVAFPRTGAGALVATLFAWIGWRVWSSLGPPMAREDVATFTTGLTLFGSIFAVLGILIVTRLGRGPHPPRRPQEQMGPPHVVALWLMVLGVVVAVFMYRTL